MRKRSMDVKIAKPCHESWDKMTPQDQGRHCASCEKVVTDFTQMSDREIINFLSSGKGSGCGRLNSRQLNNPLTTVEHSNPWYSPMTLALSTALSVFIANHADAQEPTEPLVLRDGMVTGGYDVVENNEPFTLESREFKGQVTDAETGEPIPFVNVFFAKSRIGASTDFDGIFSIPRGSEEVNHLEVSFSSIGYKSESFCPAKPDSFQNIQLIPIGFDAITGLRPEISITMGVMLGDIDYVESRPRTFMRKVGRTISWPYRRVRSAIRGW